VALEALTLRKTFPQFLPADTLGVDLNGNIVRLADLSGFFQVEFRDEDVAAEALETLRSAPGVLSAKMIPAGNAPLEGTPTDRYFHYWRYIHEDAQWHLLNEGNRHDEECCGLAVTQYDNQIESIPYWYNAEGDSNIVIAMMDVGVNDDHEDLRVINDQLPHPELFSIYPTDIVDFCGPHGTFLAGLSAALTNNTIGDDDSVGVAGICPDCSILDIAVPGCTQSRCLEAQGGGRECGSVNSAEWPTRVGNLLSEIQNGNIGRDVVALNMSFGSLDSYGHEPAILSLWNAYSMGIVCVSGSGNTSNEQPEHGFPQGLPFVMGAGGYNWLGQFWESATTCYWEDSTESCPDAAGTTVGPKMVSVCAPTSGRTITTWPWIREVGDYSDYYNSTYILTSGATAQVSGAVGLIQAVYKAQFDTLLHADDVVGLIEGTALPFSMDPWDPPPPEQGGYYRACQTCEPEDYGKGRLNIAGALEAAIDWRLGWEKHWLTETQLSEPSFVRQFTVDDEDWQEYVVSAEILVPTVGGGQVLHLPENVGWVNRFESNTFPTYGNDSMLVSMIEHGVHDAYMTRVDQTTGQATVSGFLYRKRVGDEWPWVGTLPEDVQIPYTIVRHYATAVDDVVDRSTKRIGMSPIRTPLRFPAQIEYRLPAKCSVEASVFDIRGRIVTRLFRGEQARGRHAVWWDGRNDQGHKVSSGIYWLRVKSPNDQVTRQLVVVR
jgi:hypothetical protein